MAPSVDSETSDTAQTEEKRGDGDDADRTGTEHDTGSDSEQTG